MIHRVFGRMIYSGEEAIIFDKNNVVPDHIGGMMKMLHPDHRGVILEMVATFPGLKINPGDRGIVVNTFYKSYGAHWVVLFENGTSCGIDYRDGKINDGWLIPIGIHPPTQDYKAGKSCNLLKDFENGIFKFR